MALTTKSSTIAGGSNVFDPNKKKKISPYDAFFAGADTGSADAAYGGFAAAGGQFNDNMTVTPKMLSEGEALIAGLNPENVSSTSGDVQTQKPVAPVSLLPDEGVNVNGPGGVSSTESAIERHQRLTQGTGPTGPGPTGPTQRTLISNNEEVRGDRVFMVSKYSDGTEEARDIGAASVAAFANPAPGQNANGPQTVVAAPVSNPTFANPAPGQNANGPQTVVAPEPVATSNPAIEALQQSAQAIDLPSNDELRANQMAQQAAFVDQADVAGRAAADRLSLQDLTQAVVSDRTLTPLEQKLEARALSRLKTDQFIDPNSTEITAAEKFALDRLQQEKPLLDTDSDLSSKAETSALARLASTNLLGTDGSGLAKAAEAQLLARINGRDVESAQSQLRRRQLEQRMSDSERDDMELLNRLGVLRSGDSVEALTERNTRRDEGELALDAFDEQLRDQAIAQSLDFVQRGDNVRANEQMLQRAALADVNTLQGRRDSLGLANEDLRQQAFQNTVGLERRRDDIARDNQNLQRAALSDSSNIVNARNNLDLNEANITGFLRGGATQATRQAQNDQEFRRGGFEQDVTDRTLSRLRGTLDVGQRERFEEDTRARLNAEGLARRADTRAGQALESDLFGQVAQGANQAPRTTLSGRSADRTDDAFDLNELLSRAGLTGMLDGERTLQGRGLDDQLLSTQLGRDQVISQDQRDRLAIALEAEKQGFSVDGVDRLLNRILNNDLNGNPTNTEIPIELDKTGNPTPKTLEEYLEKFSNAPVQTTLTNQGGVVDPHEAAYRARTEGAGTGGYTDFFRAMSEMADRQADKRTQADGRLDAFDPGSDVRDLATRTQNDPTRGGLTGGIDIGGLLSKGTDRAARGTAFLDELRAGGATDRDIAQAQWAMNNGFSIDRLRSMFGQRGQNANGPADTRTQTSGPTLPGQGGRTTSQPANTASTLESMLGLTGGFDAVGALGGLENLTAAERSILAGMNNSADFVGGEKMGTGDLQPVSGAGSSPDNALPIENTNVIGDALRGTANLGTEVFIDEGANILNSLNSESIGDRTTVMRRIMAEGALSGKSQEEIQAEIDATLGHTSLRQGAGDFAEQFIPGAGDIISGENVGSRLSARTDQMRGQVSDFMTRGVPRELIEAYYTLAGSRSTQGLSSKILSQINERYPRQPSTQTQTTAPMASQATLDEMLAAEAILPTRKTITQ